MTTQILQTGTYLSRYKCLHSHRWFRVYRLVGTRHFADIPRHLNSRFPACTRLDMYASLHRRDRCHIAFREHRCLGTCCLLGRLSRSDRSDRDCTPDRRGRFHRCRRSDKYCRGYIVQDTFHLRRISFHSDRSLQDYTEDRSYLLDKCGRLDTFHLEYRFRDRFRLAYILLHLDTYALEYIRYRLGHLDTFAHSDRFDLACKRLDTFHLVSRSFRWGTSLPACIHYKFGRLDMSGHWGMWYLECIAVDRYGRLDRSLRLDTPYSACSPSDTRHLRDKFLRWDRRSLVCRWGRFRLLDR